MTSRPSISTGHPLRRRLPPAGRAGSSRSSPVSSPPPSRSESPSCSPASTARGDRPCSTSVTASSTPRRRSSRSSRSTRSARTTRPALLIGIGAFLAVYAAVVGIIALRHRLVVGVVGIGLFGVIGVWASASRRAGDTVARRAAERARRGGRDRRPVLLHRSSHRDPVGTLRRTRAAPAVGSSCTAPAPLLGMLALGAAAVGAVGRALGRASRRRSRAADVVLPAPTEVLDPLPPTVQVDVRRDDAVRDAERRLLPHRHRARSRRRCGRRTTRCASTAWSTTRSSSPTTSCCNAR